jgi:predicted RNase H-like HicB family nuclease
MLNEYFDAAIRAARFETLDSGRFYGEVPLMPGVWAEGETLKECRSRLLEVMEEWTLLAYWFHSPLPVIDGIDPNLMVDTKPNSDETTGADSQAARPGISGPAVG